MILGMWYFLKQCWILISDLPGEFVFNQKEELPLISKLYWMIFLKGEPKDQAANISFLTL